MNNPNNLHYDIPDDNDINNFLNNFMIEGPETCTEINLTELDEKFSYKKDSKFSILNLNIRSLKHNFNELFIFLNRIKHKYTIIVLTETWLTNENKDIFQLEGYNSYNIIREGRRGGGVTIYCDIAYTCEYLDDLSKCENSLECLFLQVKCKKWIKPVIIGGLYRPPGYELFEEYLANISLCLNNEKLKSKNLILAGDFNLNLFNLSNTKCKEFIDYMFSYNLCPLITKATRMYNNHAGEKCYTLLDHIWTNITEACSSCVIQINITDHFPVCALIDIETNHNKPKIISFRDFSVKNLNNFKENIQIFEWDSVTNLDTVNSNTESFEKNYTSCTIYIFLLKRSKLQ